MTTIRRDAFAAAAAPNHWLWRLKLNDFKFRQLIISLYFNRTAVTNTNALTMKMIALTIVAVSRVLVRCRVANFFCQFCLVSHSFRDESARRHHSLVNCSFVFVVRACDWRRFRYIFIIWVPKGCQRRESIQKMFKSDSHQWCEEISRIFAVCFRCGHPVRSTSTDTYRPTTNQHDNCVSARLAFFNPSRCHRLLC